MYPHHRVKMVSVTAIGLLVGCGSAVPDDAAGSSHTGRVELALRTDVGTAAYELRNATFDITGPIGMALSSEDAPDASVIEQPLPVGDYLVTLAPDWTLYLVDSGQSTEVEAALVTENPAVFSILADTVTQVAFGFEIAEGSVELGSGTVQIGIDVSLRQAESVMFTEMMANPALLADSEGEWFELQNTGQAAVDLNGCIVTRDTNQFTIDAGLEIEPGEVLTFANGESPGFSSDYVYSGLTLPNTAVFVLSLTCNGELLDTLTVDPSAWPGAAGIAASLSAAATTAQSNDDPANWCAATTPYATDSGSPGSVNPDC
jgi:hypothetical protein